jgi:TatD DNase family protein
MIVTGVNEEGSIEASKLSKKYNSFLYSTVGIHPHHANEYNGSAENVIKKLIKEKHIVAVGECGLDYYRNYSSVENQKNAFISQINIANESKLPLFMHQRDAHEDFEEILKINLNKIHNGVVHCFTGTEEMLISYLEMGFYIGITGWICDERRGSGLQKIVKNIPLNRLLVETDCPYLLPRTLESKPKNRRNEPKYLPEIVKMISNQTTYTQSEIAEATYNNTIKLFNL